jgi:hypothetical protein
MYILQLLLNVVIANTEVIVTSGNKFLYACVKQVCHLWAQPHFNTVHQLLIIAEGLWSHPVLQLGKQVVVAWSKIRAVRSVIKQLPVEILQHCSSASSCIQKHTVMEEHYTMPAFHAFCPEWPYAVFFSVSQYTSDATVVPCCMNSTISTPFLSQKQLPSAFWQTFV